MPETKIKIKPKLKSKSIPKAELTYQRGYQVGRASVTRDMKSPKTYIFEERFKKLVTQKRFRQYNAEYMRGYACGYETGYHKLMNLPLPDQNAIPPIGTQPALDLAVIPEPSDNILQSFDAISPRIKQYEPLERPPILYSSRNVAFLQTQVADQDDADSRYHARNLLK